MEIQGRVGPLGGNQSLSDGVPVDPWLGKQSQTITQDFAPRYAESGYRGYAFCGALQAGVALTGLATTTTGLILINPLNSGRNLWLAEVNVAPTVANSAIDQAIVLAANVNPSALSAYTLTTALTVQPTLIGSTATAVGKLYSSVTLPAAPVVVRNIWQASLSATAYTGAPPLVKDEVAGAIGVAPGCSVSLAFIGTAITVLGSMTWVELPI